MSEGCSAGGWKSRKYLELLLPYSLQTLSVFFSGLLLACVFIHVGYHLPIACHFQNPPTNAFMYVVDNWVQVHHLKIDVGLTYTAAGKYRTPEMK